MNTKVMVGLIVLIIVLAAAGYGLTRPANTDTQPASTPTQSTNTPTPAVQPTDLTPPAQTALSVNYTDSGFSPSSLTLKAGQPVTFTNNSSGPLQLDSNPHPAHTDEPELNVGQISKGQSQSVTITKTGQWGYHNHLRASDTGSLTVQ